MTNKEIIKKIREHLVIQPYRCTNSTWNSGSSCMYRNRNGDRCFIGALIPDDKYDPQIEGITMDMVVDYVYRENSDQIQSKFDYPHRVGVNTFLRILEDIDIQGNQFQFLSVLQEIHDLEKLFEDAEEQLMKLELEYC
ncbi:MAG TPA: hypothetical protein VGA67_02835 [Candidatus Dojkabacteria bacterium]